MKKSNEDILTRKEALKKIGDYGKYSALTAIGTYLMLSPKMAQAQSGTTPPPPDTDPLPDTPGDGFGNE